MLDMWVISNLVLTFLGEQLCVQTCALHFFGVICVPYSVTHVVTQEVHTVPPSLCKGKRISHSPSLRCGGTEWGWGDQRPYNLSLCPPWVHNHHKPLLRQPKPESLWGKKIYSFGEHERDMEICTWFPVLTPACLLNWACGLLDYKQGLGLCWSPGRGNNFRALSLGKAGLGKYWEAFTKRSLARTRKLWILWRTWPTVTGGPMREVGIESYWILALAKKAWTDTLSHPHLLRQGVWGKASAGGGILFGSAQPALGRKTISSSSTRRIPRDGQAVLQQALLLLRLHSHLMKSAFLPHTSHGQHCQECSNRAQLLELSCFYTH